MFNKRQSADKVQSEITNAVERDAPSPLNSERSPEDAKFHVSTDQQEEQEEDVDHAADPYHDQFEYYAALTAELKIMEETIDGLRWEIASTTDPYTCKSFLHKISSLREERQDLIDDYMEHYPGHNPFTISASTGPPSAPLPVSDQVKAAEPLTNSAGLPQAQPLRKQMRPHKAKRKRSSVFHLTAITGRLHFACHISRKH